MKPVVAICMALLYACTVFGIEIPALPQPEFVDTEVSPHIRDSLTECRSELEPRQGDAAGACRFERERFGRACRVRLRREGFVAGGSCDSPPLKAAMPTNTDEQN